MENFDEMRQHSQQFIDAFDANAALRAGARCAEDVERLIAILEKANQMKTTVPGTCVLRKTITYQCRLNWGDPGVIKQVEDELHMKLSDLLKGTIVGDNRKFHIVLTCERPAQAGDQQYKPDIRDQRYEPDETA